MQSRKSIITVLFAALHIPAAALAEGPSYDFVEVGFAYAEPDFDVVDTSSGFEIAASKALTGRIHFTADHITVQDGPVRYKLSTLVLGWNHPVNESTDVITRTGYVRESIDVVPDGTGTGFITQFGSRSMISPDFEFNGFVTYIDTGIDNTLGAEFGVRYNLGTRISIGAEFEYYENITIFRSGLRFDFSVSR